MVKVAAIKLTEPITWQYVDTSAMDFGDAPDSSTTGFPQNYPTLLVDDGARHLQSSLRLGANLDVEADGQPVDLARGDDNNGVSGVDDEDGIRFAQAPSSAVLSPRRYRALSLRRRQTANWMAGSTSIAMVTGMMLAS